MSDYHIGRLIRGFRESKNISQKKLYYGLKNTRVVSRIENGEQEVSKLLVDILLERMGLSTDLYGYEFPIKEYELFQSRADLLELLEKGQYKEAADLCEEYEKNVSKTDKFEQQFIRTIKLLIVMEEGTEPEYLKQEAEEILLLTIPKFKVENMCDYLFGGMERMLIAVQAEALCRMKGHEKDGMEIYYKLLFYIEEHCTDFLEQEKQIPPLILLMVRWLWKWEEYSKIWICEKAIKVLRNNMRLSLLEPLMEYEMKGWETGFVNIPEGESDKEWKEGLKALYELREEYGIKNKYTEENPEAFLFVLMVKQNYRGQILGDALRRIRKEKGISVEELAENICEPETLRRIELGTIKPRQNTYSQLMKKLGQEEYAYHPMIYSENYRMYECCQEVKKYMHKAEYEKAEYELRKLENGLDISCKVNHQIILKFSGILKERVKKIGLEERLTYLKKALGVTMSVETELGKWPLNREEMILWNNIASTLEQMGKSKEAIYILETIKVIYEQSDVNILNYKQEYMMIICNLSAFLGREKRYEESLGIINYSIPLAVEWEQGNYLTILLYNKVWNMERLMEEKQEDKKAIERICFPILKHIFSIASIIQYTFYKRHIKQHCKNYYTMLIEEIF